MKKSLLIGYSNSNLSEMEVKLFWFLLLSSTAADLIKDSPVTCQSNNTACDNHNHSLLEAVSGIELYQVDMLYFNCSYQNLDLFSVFQHDFWKCISGIQEIKETDNGLFFLKICSWVWNQTDRLALLFLRNRNYMGLQKTLHKL